MIEQLNKFDARLFLELNSLNNPFLDELMLYISETWVWIPLFIVLFYFVFKYFGKRGYWVLLTVAIVITLTDQISTQVLKPSFKRLRPCHDIELESTMHLVGNCGGKHGFVSSHAANTFGGAMFFFFLFRNKIKGIGMLFLWSTLVSFSRVYLGRHYPGDILFGAILGLFIASLVYFLLNLIVRHLE